MTTSEDGESAMLKLVSAGPGDKAASSILERREQMRATNNGGLLLPPPGPEVFARAKMVDPSPGQTIRKPNAELQAVLDWLQRIHDYGGSAEDLYRAWQHFQSPFKQAQAKLPARDFLEQLVASARAREIYLQRRAEKETRPQKNVDLYRSNVEAAVARVKKAEAEERSAARDELARLRAELARAEETLKAATP